MRGIRPILAVVLLVVAVVSWWPVRQADPTPPPVATPGTRMIDYAVTGLDVVQMTTAGQPAHRLRVPKLRHFTDDDTTEFERPHLTVFQDDAPPWQVRGEQALASADGDIVLFTGEVRVEHAGDTDTRPLQLVTRNLRVQPRQDYAETDEKVRVESDSDWMEAVGMQAWLRPSSRLKFLSQVTAHHVPR